MLSRMEKAGALTAVLTLKASIKASSPSAGRKVHDSAVPPQLLGTGVGDVVQQHIGGLVTVIHIF